MNNWTKQHKRAIMAVATKGLLSAQIYGRVTDEQRELVSNEIDGMEIDSNTVDNSEVNELIQAMVGAAVYGAEHALVSGFLKDRVERHPIDFNEIPTNEKDGYVGEKLGFVGDKIKEILSTFPEGTESFILCSPLEITILQCSTKHRFEPALESDWKGASWTRVVGRLFKVPVYSYLFDITEDYNGLLHEFVCDTIIVGYFDEDTQKTITHTIPLTNISLV